MKKILSLGLAVTMAMAAMPAAYAADYTQGTQVEYVATTQSAYTITVPAKMTPKLGEAVTGTVTLSGSWASNETVKVTADEKVVLTNSINPLDTHELAVNLPVMEYAGDNTEAKTYTGTVTLAEMPAAALFGEWTGKFNYNVEFDDGKEPTVAFYDVKYRNNSFATAAITLGSDGTFYMFDSDGDTIGTGSYTTDGQTVIVGTGTYWILSEDGYTLSMKGYPDTTYVYTP